MTDTQFATITLFQFSQCLLLVSIGLSLWGRS